MRNQSDAGSFISVVLSRKAGLDDNLEGVAQVVREASNLYSEIFGDLDYFRQFFGRLFHLEERFLSALGDACNGWTVKSDSSGYVCAAPFLHFLPALL